MFDADLAYPFTLGLLAAFNPCGFAMLPVYVSFFLGSNSDEETSAVRNLARALKVGAALTAGFIAVFGGFGLLTSSLLSSSTVLEYTPYVTFVLGLALVPLGIAMTFFGYEPKISTPRLDKGGDSGEVLSMFLFGVSYAVVSLGCTIGVFIAGVSSVFTSDGYLDGVSVFVAYGLGMGAVILTLTVALALARTSVATNMRKILPWIGRISGVVLILSGVYLAIYGWWEIQVLRGNNAGNALVDFFENMRIELTIWIEQTGGTRLGIGLLLVLGAVIINSVWSSLGSARLGWALALVAAWVGAEIARWNGERLNLFLKPGVRTIADIPERFANWFTDPLRWAVLGELVVVAVIAWTVWFRVVRSRMGPGSDAESGHHDELVGI